MLTPLAQFPSHSSTSSQLTIVPMVTDSTWPPLWPNSLPILQQFIFRDYRDARIRIMLYSSVLQPPLF